MPVLRKYAGFCPMICQNVPHWKSFASPLSGRRNNSAKHGNSIGSQVTRLADEFTRQDLIELRQRLSMDVSNKALSRQLSAWKSRQLIEETPDGKYKNLKR